MHHSTAPFHTITKSNLNDYTLSTGATYLHFTYNSMIKDRHKQESTPLGLHSSGMAFQKTSDGRCGPKPKFCSPKDRKSSLNRLEFLGRSSGSSGNCCYYEPQSSHSCGNSITELSPPSLAIVYTVGNYSHKNTSSCPTCHINGPILPHLM